MGRPKLDIKNRILSNVFYSPDGCWYWTGPINNNSYGRIYVSGRREFTHRLSYKIFNGEINGSLVCHTCDNKLCVNPDHLFLGNHSINALDMHAKGKSNKPIGERIGIAKLNINKVIEIRNMFHENMASKTNIAKHFGVHPNTIHAVITERTWKHI